MTTVTTSILLTGTPVGPGAAVPAFGQTTSPQDDSWKSDPEVLKAADTILGWLKGTTNSTAKTREEILKQFPGLKPVIVDKALKRLVIYTADIKRLGDGSKDKPYTYYEKDQHGG
jgi:hypothetical protein